MKAEKKTTEIFHLLEEVVKWCALLSLAFHYNVAEAKLSEVKSASELKEVYRLAKMISVVQPYLDEGRYLQYAWGIHKAADQYGIEPEVLISITQQETTFREDLPEGKAGERGICQIRKMWLKNPKFRAEFKKATIHDLHKPAKSFMFAAWILKGLKDTSSKTNTIPYWSFYNAVRFENRFKYFLAVNKYVSQLKKFENYINSGVPDEGREVAAAKANPNKPLVSYPSYNNLRPATPQPKPAPVIAEARRELNSQRPVVAAAPRELKVVEASTGPTAWISDALKKIQSQSGIREDMQGTEGKRIVPTSIMRTAQELGVSNFYKEASVQD